MHSRRVAIAIGFSLAFHGGLLFLLSRARMPIAPPISQREGEVVELEIGESAPRASLPLTRSPPEKPTTAKHRPRPSTKRTEEGDRAHSSAGSTPAHVARSDDIPRKTSLVPSFDSTRGWPSAPAPEPRGHTTHGAGEAPDPAAVAAMDAARVKSRVDEWLSDTLAARRVENGLVDEYFGTLRHALERGTENPPAFDPDFLRNLYRGWASIAEAYGSNSGWIESASPVARGKQEAPGDHFDSLTRTYGQAAPARRLAEGLPGAMVAIVEIRQTAGGKVNGTLLLQSSGNPMFDAHVMRGAPAAIQKLPEPPQHGAGIHPEGIRSAWAFEGRIIYKKKLRDVDLKKDWWYFAASAPLALATGTFDETTGDVYVVDFRDPKFVCKVKLLRVY